MTDDASAREQVIYHREGRIGYLTLNRPEVRNALSPELRDDFNSALDRLEADLDASVAILRGAGPSFCSGFDLTRTSPSTQSTQADAWNDRHRLRSWMELALRIWSFPRPIVAQVHGHCLAGGILFPLCCDIVIIADDCAVGWPRLPMGAGFMDGAMSLLIGQRRAKQISYIVGSRITGAEAAEWGYANWSVPADELEQATLTFARRMAKTPRSVLEIRKAAITRANEGPFRNAILGGVEWDALAHVDPAVNTMRGWVRQHGMKAMIEGFEGNDDPYAYFESLSGDSDSAPV